MDYYKEIVLDALTKAWSLKSARQWTPENPAAGQCNVTALLVNDLFGGRILATPVPGGLHFYNHIQGEAVDFTASQFDQPVDYQDLPAKCRDLQPGIATGEYESLKKRFLREYSATPD